MSRYRGRRSGGSSRLIPFIIALLVAIAAIVLVIINVTQDKTPADDVVDDTQQGDVTPETRREGCRWVGALKSAQNVRTEQSRSGCCRLRKRA